MTNECKKLFLYVKAISLFIEFASGMMITLQGKGALKRIDTGLY